MLFCIQESKFNELESRGNTLHVIIYRTCNIILFTL